MNISSPNRIAEMTDTLEASIRDQLLVKLWQYWQFKCADRLMPSRGDIDPADLLKVLPHLVIMDVIDHGARFRFRLVGTDFVQNLGMEATQRFVDEVYPAGPNLDYVQNLYREVVQFGKPTYSETSFYLSDRQKERTISRLLLPLSSDGENVDMLLGGYIFETADILGDSTVLSNLAAFKEIKKIV